MVDVHTKNNEMCNNAIMSPCLIIYVYDTWWVPTWFCEKKTKCKVNFLGLVKHTGMSIIEIEQHSTITLHKPLFR
jgi:hypothetical protein